MKTNFSCARTQSGSAVVITLVLVAIALGLMAVALRWTSTAQSQIERSNQYTRTVAAAEAATEKVYGMMQRDYMSGGERLVRQNIDTYRGAIAADTTNAYFKEWDFVDLDGDSVNKVLVDTGTVTNYQKLNSVYTGLSGFVTTYSVVAHAREREGQFDVVAGVRQELELTRIPIFQFAMYSSTFMEIGCGQPFTISGPVHAQGDLWVQPISDLTFESDVTAVGIVHYSRHPLDPRIPPYGATTYMGQKDSKVAALHLPIGTNNTVDAVRQIILPPPSGEDPNSPMSNIRYYNLADMVVTVKDTGLVGTSGRFNGFFTVVPTNELSQFISTSASFYDWREEKTIRPVDLDVGAFKDWCATNANLRSALGYVDVASVYIHDLRSHSSSEMAAVRVHNGRVLPSRGLTVATMHPLYVWGHFNQYEPSHLGTTNTVTTLPASLACDAINVLSPNWTDGNSTSSLNSRQATPSTVNAAFLTGNVPTILNQYSGGMENFPRFHEKWGGSAPLTYNGSMILMFSSLQATNRFGKSGVYSPPKRDWAFDKNFQDPTKLPPLTPSLLKVLRGTWQTVAPDSKVAAVTF